MAESQIEYVTEYTVVVGDPWGPDSFIKNVNRKLRKGWLLHGSPALGGEGGEGNVIVQALIREVEAKRPRSRKRKAG